MKRLLILFIFLVSLPLLLNAQTTNVSATLTDGDGQIWNNGTYTISFVPTPGNPGPYKYCSGSDFDQNPKVGSFSNVGLLTIVLPSNTSICPSGSQWQFVSCPNASSPCGNTKAGVTGANQDLSSPLSSALPVIRFPAINNAYGYADTEVNPIPKPGGSYWNVTTGCLRLWSGTAWACSTGSIIDFASPPPLGNVTPNEVFWTIGEGKYTNTKANPTKFPGADIGLQSLNAFADCTACNVTIPSGTYSFTNTIRVPANSTLECNGPATILNWNSVGGTAILVDNVNNAHVKNCTVTTSQANPTSTGIKVNSTLFTTVEDVLVHGFHKDLQITGTDTVPNNNTRVINATVEEYNDSGTPGSGSGISVDHAIDTWLYTIQGYDTPGLAKYGAIFDTGILGLYVHGLNVGDVSTIFRNTMPTTNTYGAPPRFVFLYNYLSDTSLSASSWIFDSSLNTPSGENNAFFGSYFELTNPWAGTGGTGTPGTSGFEFNGGFEISIISGVSRNNMWSGYSINGATNVRLINSKGNSNGFEDFDWLALNAYPQNVCRTPTVGNAGAYTYCAIVAGTTGAVHPTWPQIVTNTVVDGTVTWKNAGAFPNSAGVWAKVNSPGYQIIGGEYSNNIAGEAGAQRWGWYQSAGNTNNVTVSGVRFLDNTSAPVFNGMTGDLNYVQYIDSVGPPCIYLGTKDDSLCRYPPVNGMKFSGEIWAGTSFNISSNIFLGAPAGIPTLNFAANTYFNWDGGANQYNWNIAATNHMFLNLDGLSLHGHLNQTVAKNFSGTCIMAASTTCTFTLNGSYATTPVCIAGPQSASTLAGSCTISGTTVTINAASNNSEVWGAVLIGNPN